MTQNNANVLKCALPFDSGFCFQSREEESPGSNIKMQLAVLSALARLMFIALYSFNGEKSLLDFFKTLN